MAGATDYQSDRAAHTANDTETAQPEATRDSQTRIETSGAIPPVGDDFDTSPRRSATDAAYDQPYDTPTGNQAAILTEERLATIMGKKQRLLPGTYVEVLREDGDMARVRVFSGHSGHTALVPLRMLDRQPALSEKGDHKKDLDKGGYMQYRSVLWNGEPKASDVDQGHLNNCYVMAPAAALAAEDPDAIKRLFGSHEPEQTSYPVTLYKREGKGFKKVTRNIDTMLPSFGDLADKDGTPIYTGADNGSRRQEMNTDRRKMPLWPLLLEKAFAELYEGADGGYEALDGGGVAARAMEMLTGRRANVSGWPDKETAIARLRELHEDGKSVMCNTRSDPGAKALLARLGMQGWHFYSFSGFSGSKLLFRNPIGTEHAVLSEEEFAEVFESMQARGAGWEDGEGEGGGLRNTDRGGGLRNTDRGGGLRNTDRGGSGLD